jgi:N-acetyl-anhydromuramyl-L-alanine amidase AmpD
MATRMRVITTIILHCSDSDIEAHDNIETITNWHLLRGFSSIGYHYFINKQGSIFNGRPVEKIGAHCAWHNIDSIGICLSGEQLFNVEQFLTASILIKDLMQKFGIEQKNILPHNYFNAYKTCPNFDIDRIISLL